MSLDINKEEYRLFKGNENPGPVVMLNLLKFKPDGGAEAYAKYAATVGKMVEELGGKVLYAGSAREMLTGTEKWDAVALIRYPSRKAFLQMIATPEYQKAHADREKGLERAVLYATSPTDLRLGAE